MAYKNKTKQNKTRPRFCQPSYLWLVRFYNAVPKLRHGCFLLGLQGTNSYWALEDGNNWLKLRTPSSIKFMFRYYFYFNLTSCTVYDVTETGSHPKMEQRMTRAKANLQFYHCLEITKSISSKQWTNRIATHVSVYAGVILIEHERYQMH